MVEIFNALTCNSDEVTILLIPKSAITSHGQFVSNNSRLGWGLGQNSDHHQWGCHQDATDSLEVEELECFPHQLEH